MSLATPKGSQKLTWDSRSSPIPKGVAQTQRFFGYRHPPAFPTSFPIFAKPRPRKTGQPEMNTYTYNGASWLAIREVNDYTVAVKLLKAKEAHRSALTHFLWHALGIMLYTCKPGTITYTVTETREGYSFHMEWETTQVKAAAIQEYIALLKGPGKPDPGKTEWRNAISWKLDNMLRYSSVLEAEHTPVEGSDLAKMRMEAMVKFPSLVDAPNISRLYKDGPQRQVSIFDLFEYQWVNRDQLSMEFKLSGKDGLAVRIRIPGAETMLSLGEGPGAHKNLERFLRAIRNIIHSLDEKPPLVNVATIRTTAYYDQETDGYSAWNDEEQEDPWDPVEVLHTRFAHYRDDGTHCSMDIQSVNGWRATFHVLIREGAELELEDDWFYRNSGRLIRKSSWREQPTREQMQAPVRLAFTADDYDLGNAARWALNELLEELGPEKYKDLFGAEPPIALVRQILGRWASV